MATTDGRRAGPVMKQADGTEDEDEDEDED
jgi:hypothetical protein